MGLYGEGERYVTYDRYVSVDSLTHSFKKRISAELGDTPRFLLAGLHSPTTYDVLYPHQ